MPINSSSYRYVGFTPPDTIIVADAAQSTGRAFNAPTATSGAARSANAGLAVGDGNVMPTTTTNVTTPTGGQKVHWGYSIVQDGMLAPPNGYYPTSMNAAAKATIKSVPNNIVNIHVGGFGVYPPEYINNTFDWGGDLQGVSANGLDDGVGYMRDMTNATSGIKMITLCTCPGWMKASGQTFAMEEAPTDAMEAEWAASCAAIAARYTDVIYFQFWNEMKGLFGYGGVGNRWAYEKYTRMYNLTWAAIKAVRPDAKLGGPYPVLSSGGPTMSNPSSVTFPGGTFDQRDLDVMTYWKNNATGFDFICVDGWVGNQRGGPAIGAGATNQTQLGKFIRANQWIRANIHPTKVIVWSEFYPSAGTVSESVAGDYVIEVMTRTKNECAVGDGIWYLQWGENAEPPRPFNYSTGAELAFVTPKLRTWEAG